MKHLGISKIPLCDKTPVNNNLECWSKGGNPFIVFIVNQHSNTPVLQRLSLCK